MGKNKVKTTNKIPCKNGMPYISPNSIERFFAKVEIPLNYGPGGDCWKWNAGKTKQGYGRFMLRTEKGVYAHRISYLFFKGDPGDKCVLHKCDTPECTNPEHLFLGTHADNMRDRDKKGRGYMKPGMKIPGVNAKLTEGQVREIRSKYRPRVVTRQMLADEYGVCIQNIDKILGGFSWKHIA